MVQLGTFYYVCYQCGKHIIGITGRMIFRNVILTSSACRVGVSWFMEKHDSLSLKRQIDKE